MFLTGLVTTPFRQIAVLLKQTYSIARELSMAFFPVHCVIVRRSTAVHPVLDKVQKLSLQYAAACFRNCADG